MTTAELDEIKKHQTYPMFVRFWYYIHVEHWGYDYCNVRPPEKDNSIAWYNYWLAFQWGAAIGVVVGLESIKEAAEMCKTHWQTKVPEVFGA